MISIRCYSCGVEQDWKDNCSHTLIKRYTICEGCNEERISQESLSSNTSEAQFAVVTEDGINALLQQIHRQTSPPSGQATQDQYQDPRLSADHPDRHEALNEYAKLQTEE